MSMFMLSFIFVMVYGLLNGNQYALFIVCLYICNDV